MNLLMVFSFAFVIFLLSGGLAFISTVLWHKIPDGLNGKEVAFTPIVGSLLVFSVLGFMILLKVPNNIRNGDVKLAEKQFFVGWIFVLGSTALMELVWRLAMS